MNQQTRRGSPSRSSVTRIPNKWDPRGYQLPIWGYLENGGKRAIAIWHRRSGKDDLALHWTATQVFQRPATYWHCLPLYAQARKAIWSAVNPKTGIRRIDEAFPKALRANTNEQEMFIRFVNGATWQVVGSDRYDATVGSPPAGIVFSEWALANPAAWGYLAPILVENNGWAIFITTSRGRNHAKSMLDMAREPGSGWFHEVLTVDDTGVLTAEAVEAQRREYHGIFGEEAGDALIEQEYNCSFEAAVLGAYYGRQMADAEREGRVTALDVDRTFPVHTAWDIGVDDAMAIWCFQVFPGRVHVVDYYEAHGHGFEHYAAWLDERRYHGVDWVPHDARVRDPSAPEIVNERGQKVARSRLQTLKALGRNPRVAPDHSLMDGIEAARNTIPRCRFDAARCARGLECLREYKAEYSADIRAFLRTPKHDWASHGADAWRCLAMSWREPMADDRPKTAKQLSEELTKPRTYDDVLDDANWER